jgi:hypothetical protein
MMHKLFLEFTIALLVFATPVAGMPKSSHLALQAATFDEGDAIQVSWFDASKSPTDWVTVVAADAPDRQYGPWVYTQGKAEGIFVVENLQAGDYEARLYFDWPKGGYTVVDRLKFSVMPVLEASLTPAITSTYLYLATANYAADRLVNVGWHDTTGNAHDWLTVVPIATPDNKWGPWIFTGAKKSGWFNAGKLAPGAYEVRLYFDWPKGGYTVRDKISFNVR